MNKLFWRTFSSPMKFCQTHKFGFFLFFIIFSPFLLKSQSEDFNIKKTGRSLSKIYTKDEHLGHETTSAGIHADDGRMYFANNRALMQFDGKEWRLYSGLDDNYTDVLQGLDGKIYVLTKSAIGYYSPSQSGVLEYHSLNSKIPAEFKEQGNFLKFYRGGNKIFIQAPLGILIYDMSSEIMRHLNSESIIKSGFIFKEEFFAFGTDNAVYSFSGDQISLVTKGANSLKNEEVITAQAISQNEVLIGTSSGKLFKYNFNSYKPFDTEIASDLMGQRMIEMSVFGDYVAILTMYNGVYVINLSGQLIQYYNYSPNSEVVENRGLFFDSNGDLWLCRRGMIVHLSFNSAYTFIGREEGVNGYVLDMQRVGDFLYLATDRGVFYKKDDAAWVFPNEKKKAFSKLEGLDNWVQIFVEKDGLLFAGMRGGLILINGNSFEKLYSGESMNGEGVAMANEDRVIFGSSEGRLHVFEKQNGKWRYQWQVKGFQHEVDFIEEAGDGDFWVTDSGLGVIKIKFNANYDSITQTKKYGLESGLPAVQGNRMYRHKKGLVFLTEKGIYQYDSASDKFVPDFSYGGDLKNSFVVRFTELSNGSVMVYSKRDTDYEYSFLRKTADSFILEKFPHQLINKFSAEYITSFGGDQAWIGSNGIMHYDPDFQQKDVVNARAIITKVRLVGKKDSVLYGGNPASQMAILSPKNVALSFGFSSSFYDQPDKVLYQTLLEGLDDDWSSWSIESSKSYTSLPFGNYTFKVRAKNIYDQTSQIAEYSFTITTPWYFTVWAFLIYSILFIVVIWLIVVLYTKNLKRKNFELEKVVEKRTMEIMMQAEEIRSQKEKAEADNEKIQRQANKLLELDKVKSRFFANISHELRTPLTLINAPLEKLISEGNLKDENLAKTIEVATRNGKNLLSLVEEILDLAKLDAGKLELVENPIRLKESLELIADSFGQGFQEKDISFELSYKLDDNLVLMTDERKLDKIIRNLLSNAFKFTPNKGSISLNVDEDKVTSEIKILVKDNGMGIHPEDLPFVFDRYFQSNQPDKKAEGGTGIGLALVKELVGLLRGNITVESELGLGTSFMLKIPNIAVDKHTLMTASTIDNQKLDVALRTTIELYNAKFKVENPVLLITEDHPDMRDFISATLSPYFTVLQAENGAVALKILQTEKVDVLISDIMMPVMDGLELIDEIKKDKRLHQLSLIMLTARADQEDKLNALTLGIDDYLTKPFSSAEFLARIKNILDNRVKIIRELDNLTKAESNLGSMDVKAFIVQYDFSEREIEVMRLMAQRKTNTQIAEALYVSLNTVKFHMKNIYSKLGIKNRLEAIDYVQLFAD